MNLAESPAESSKGRRVLTHTDYDRFQPMVRRIAMRLARRVPSHITVNDLVGCGWVGLTEAFGRSAVGMPDNELEAYLSYRIKGAMLDYLRSLEPGVREIRNASRRVARAIRKLTDQLGRPPEENEIASGLGLTQDGYRDMLQLIAGAGMARLELLEFDEQFVEHTGEPPDEQAARRILGGAVSDAILLLPARLQQVLALYYQEECTLKEVGAVLGVTESRASQLHSEAMHRLRAAIGKE